MILIEEKLSKKLPTYTSLFFRLPCYDKNTFEILVQSSDSIYDKSTNTFEFPLNRLYFIVNCLISFDDVELRTYQEVAKEKIDCSKYKFKVKPYKHQLEGIEYGVNRENGWLLLDDMGLGKTSQMINIADILRKREGLSHCLIICGVNSLKYNWEEEIHKFSDLDCVILGKKISKNGRISFTTIGERCKQLKDGVKEFFIITNIETLQHKEFADAFNKSKSKIDMIVFDEAHKCKEPTTLSAKTLMKLKAKRKIALSGTLIVNNPENAFVPLKWSENTLSTFTQFKRTYNVYGGFGGVQVIGYKNLELLQDLLKHCSLRRLSSEVLDLPEIVYETEYVELKNEQRELYDTVSEGIATELDKLDHKPTIMEEITINMRLRQITASPSIVSTTVSQSAKLDRLEELVEKIVAQGSKVVVFCSFKGTACEAFERLKNYNPVLVTGDTAETDVNLYKTQFQNENDKKVFIGTWQKCGTGITLTAANYLIFIDTPWTDSDFKQAAKRIYRIGQDKPSFIITLIAKDTYDERVKEIIDNKEYLSGFLVDNKFSELLNIFGEM